METVCDCGQTHHEGSNYYVSVVDGPKKFQVLAGPYKTHQEALALVPTVTRIAQDVDPRAAFYAFGTVAMKPDFTKPGILNDKIILTNPTGSDTKIKRSKLHADRN